jgi:hypothetical protein
MTDEAKGLYMQDIKNILTGSGGVGDYSKDFYGEESEMQLGDVNKRAEIFYDMLGEYNYPKLSYGENEGYLGRRGSYRSGNVSEMIQGKVGEDQEIYIDPSREGTSGQSIPENRFASALGLEPSEETYVGLSTPEQTLLAEMGHAQSYGEQSPSSQKRVYGWDKIGTGGNVMALLENVMGRIGQRGLNLGYGLMPEKGYDDESAIGNIRMKLGKSIGDASGWLAGYTREGSEEYNAHQINEPNLEEEYRRRIAGYY